MTTALFLIDLDVRERTLSRLLLAADGRAATVIGLTTVPGPMALLWLDLPAARVSHVAAALRRLLDVRAAEVAEEAGPAMVQRHRVHVSELVDVSVEMEIDGVRRSGAGDGLTLLSATNEAVTRCVGGSSRARESWLTVHPVTGEAVAIVRGPALATYAVGPTPEAAALSAVLASVPADDVPPWKRVQHASSSGDAPGSRRRLMGS
jgi:hypothetical protein